MKLHDLRNLTFSLLGLCGLTACGHRGAGLDDGGAGDRVEAVRVPIPYKNAVDLLLVIDERVGDVGLAKAAPVALRLLAWQRAQSQEGFLGLWAHLPLAKVSHAADGRAGFTLAAVPDYV